MAGQISALIINLRAAMAATFPDLKADGIFQYEQLDRIPWADLTPPYGAIVVSKWQAAADWGAANFAMVSQIELIRVQAESGDTSLATIPDNLELLWQYLINNRLPNVNTLSFPLLDWGDEIPGNEIFADKNYRYRAGRLVIEVLLGYTA